MKVVVVSGSFWGRAFTFRFKIYEEMAKEKTVRVRITDGYGIGYAAGREYEVSASEAKRLIEAKKAVPVKGETLVEKATRRTPKKEIATK